MRIYIRHKDDGIWKDITANVHTPSLIMNETMDGTFSSLSFVIRSPKVLHGIDMTKTIPPKLYYIKLTEGNIEALETESNTWFFVTAENNSARIRKEIPDQVESLYVQEINCEDIISVLDNKNLPNYTVTQPKSKFFSTDIKGGGAEFVLDVGFKQDGTEIILDEGIKRELGTRNMTNEITFGYDDIERKHYIEFNEISEVGLVSTFELGIAKTAPSYYKAGILGAKMNVGVTRGKDLLGFYIWEDMSRLIFNVKTNYYKDNIVVATEKKSRDINYNGGKVSADTPLFGEQMITGLAGLGTAFLDLVVNKNEDADKVRIYFYISAPEERSVIKADGLILPIRSEVTGISGKDSYVKTYLDSIIVKAETSSYNKPVDTHPTMMLEFVEKALFDYNLNAANKVFLSNDLIPILNIPMKEGEYNGYTLRGLLERVFKYVGIAPKYKMDGSITYRRTRKEARYIDFEQAEGAEKEHLSADFYDKVVSSTKNLVSEQNFTREIVPLTSVDIEFANMSTENSGFITTNKIYYVSQAILHTPDLEIEIAGQTITTNMDKPYYWDITKRLFEEDVYNSFPNIKLDGDVTDSTDPNPRSFYSLLTKANTIFYKSGSNVIGGLFNQGDYVPDFSLWSGIVELVSSAPIQEYAITELLIVLAYTQVIDVFGNKLTPPNLKLADIANFTLDLTYVPIFDEITTKYLSTMDERKGLDWEKKLNIRDKIVSYEINEQVLRNEMEQKGNEKIGFTEYYDLISNSIPVNSIINDNYYITSKQIKINKNKVEVDYIAQKDFILQNDDIRLPVEFERYNVPYEYAERELLIDNTLVFLKEYSPKYLGSNLTTRTFIEKVFLTPTDELEGTLYAKVDIDGNKFLMRTAKIDSRFTMIFKCSFLDNYTAGIQRYLSGIHRERFYTIPLRYTDGNGKFELLSNLEIGYNTSEPDLRLKREDNEPYDLKLFPAGEYGGKEAIFNVKLVDLREPLMLNKDAREKVSITYTSYLQSETNDIKFYNFKAVTKLGVLTNDIELTDDVVLKDINYSDFGGSFTTSLTTVIPGVFKVKITSDDILDFENGIVLINEEQKRQTLVGVIKEPIINGNDLEFVIASSINRDMFLSGIMPNSTNAPFPIYYRDIQAIQNKIHKITIDGVEKDWQLIENDSILSIMVKPSVPMYLNLQTGEWSYEGDNQSYIDDLRFKEIRIYYDS